MSLNENTTQTTINSLLPQLAAAAQSVYDEWEQDEDGVDEMYGGGGICDDIADAFCSVFSNNNLECTTKYNEYDTHTSSYVYDREAGMGYNVDIHPSFYEKGYGYTWTKIPGVTFTPAMISVDGFVLEDGWDDEDLNEVVATRDQLFPRTTDHEHLHAKKEPAMLTWEEYYEVVNPGDKYHESETYNWSMDKENVGEFDPKNPEYVLVKNKQVGKINLQFYRSIRKGQYGSWDDETKTYTKTPEDVINKAGKTVVDNSLVCYHPEEGIAVGGAQDEWGAVLIYTVKEYRGLGIGEELVKMYRHYFPYKGSGGFTENGYKQIQKYYRSVVEKYMRNGIYSDMVKKGEMTADRAKAIIASAKLQPKFTAPKSELANTYGGSGEYSLYVGNSSIVIFDTDLKKLHKSQQLDDMHPKFLSKLIKCFLYFNQLPHDQRHHNLYSAYATDVKFMSLGMEMLLSSGEKVSDFFIDKNFDENTKALLNQVFSDESKFKVRQVKNTLDKNPPTLRVLSTKKKTFNFEHLKSLSKQWFKKNDSYQELETWILEYVHSLSS